jgi:hypothetical protein
MAKKSKSTRYKYDCRDIAWKKVFLKYPLLVIAYFYPELLKAIDPQKTINCNSQISCDQSQSQSKSQKIFFGYKIKF